MVSFLAGINLRPSCDVMRSCLFGHAPLIVVVELLSVVPAALHVADSEAHCEPGESNAPNSNQNICKQICMLTDDVDDFSFAGACGGATVPHVGKEVEFRFTAKARALEVSLQDLEDGEVFCFLYVIQNGLVVRALVEPCLAHVVDLHQSCHLI